MRERESSNPGAKTIEEELQRALTAAGAISIENSTSLQKVGRSVARSVAHSTQRSHLSSNRCRPIRVD